MSCSRFRSARHQTQADSPAVLARDAHIVRAGQAGGDLHPVAAANHPVIGGALGHGQVEPVVAQLDRPPRGRCLFRLTDLPLRRRFRGAGKPVGDDVQHPPPDLRREKNASVKEHDVGPRRITARRCAGAGRILQARPAVGGEKRGQVLRDGGVGGEGKAKLLEARLPRIGFRVERHAGEETVQDQFLHLRPIRVDRQSTADELRTTARQVDGRPLRGIFGQERFFGLARQPHQDFPLPRGQASTACDAVFEMVGQRQIQIVPSKNQVIADGNPVELQPRCIRCRRVGWWLSGQLVRRGGTALLVGLPACGAGPYANQGEVRRATADIAHQDLLSLFHAVLPAVFMRVNPGVKRSLRLLDQNDAFESRPRRRLHGQLAGDFVKGRRQREHDILLGQLLLRESPVPRFGNVLQIPGADLHGRKPLDVGVGLPGEQIGGTIHARVTQPGLGRSDQAAGDRRPVIAGQESDNRCRAVCCRWRATVARCGSTALAAARPPGGAIVLLGRPGGGQRLARKFPLGRFVMKRRECLARLDHPRRHHLRHGKRPHLPRRFGGIDVAHGRIRGSQIDAHDETARWRLLGQRVEMPWVSGHDLTFRVFADGEFQFPAAVGVGADTPQFEHPQFRDPRLELARAGKIRRRHRPPGAMASSESVSSRSAPSIRGIRSPGLSSLRVALLKKRKVAGSPTTSPISLLGTSVCVPSSMPNGTTHGPAAAGGAGDGQAGRFDADVVRAGRAAANPDPAPFLAQP